jgi:hypothetical protein
MWALVKCYWQGKTEILRKNLPHVHFAHNNPHTDRTLNPRGERTAADCLKTGTVFESLKFVRIVCENAVLCQTESVPFSIVLPILCQLGEFIKTGSVITGCIYFNQPFYFFFLQGLFQ